MEKPIFKVGDAPEWTIDLIKQLPFGTSLTCAVDERDIFIYKGQSIKHDKTGDLFINNKGDVMYFVDVHDKYDNYAKILSLPESYLTPDKPEEEFKAGDMVEVSRPDAMEDPDTWKKGKYYFTGGIAKSGMYIVQDEQGGLKCVIKIRKIQPDPDKKLAKEILEKWGLLEDGKCLPNLVSAVIEGIKKGRGE